MTYLLLKKFTYSTVQQKSKFFTRKSYLNNKFPNRVKTFLSIHMPLLSKCIKIVMEILVRHNLIKINLSDFRYEQKSLLIGVFI